MIRMLRGYGVRIPSRTQGTLLSNEIDFQRLGLFRTRPAQTPNPQHVRSKAGPELDV